MSCRIHARAPRRVDAPRVERDEAILTSFLSDAAHVPGGFSAGIAFPSTEAEVAAGVIAAEHVLPVGAQSSLTGGATPRGELLVSTRALTDVAVIDAHHVRVGAGVPLTTLQRYLAGYGLYYPPVPTFEGAFVGGTIATNAAGAATFKYGTTRSWVTAITVVLANGAVLDLSRDAIHAGDDGTFEIVMPDASTVMVCLPTYAMPAVPKLSAGYYAAPSMDPIDLFIGCEGTLGVVTSAVLRVIDKPVRATALITCRDDGQAIAVTSALRGAAHLAWVGRGPLDVAAIEYMDSRSLQAVPDDAFQKAGVGRPHRDAVMLLVQIEIGGREEDALTALADILDASGVDTDPIMTAAGDEPGAQRLFDLREAVPASVNSLIARAKEHDVRIEKTAGDFIVPFEHLETSIAIYRRALTARHLDHAIWGHVSDGNLHVNVIPRTMEDVVEGRDALVEMAGDVIRMGGSPLAEHGVGRSAMKQRLLRELYGESGIEQMRRVKRALDPAWRLAPGVLFPAGDR